MTSTAFRGYFEEFFWKYSNTIGNKHLTMNHVLPCFMILVIGLILSTIIFILEWLLCLNKKKIRDESVAGNTTHAAITDRDINDTIMVKAEIQLSHSMDDQLINVEQWSGDEECT